MAAILIVDDDAHIRDVVRYALEREGHAVTAAADGEEALARLGEGGVELVVLDVLLPDLDGLSICRRVRAEGTLPVILLSSRGEVSDRVIGLELGADDYLPKPFSPRELVIRVATVLRRAAAPPPADPVLRLGALSVDPAAHDVRVADTRVHLTATELAILVALLGRRRLLTRAQLIARAGGGHITERTIDTHVKRIRAKLRAAGLAHDAIETVHGVGYKAADLAS